MTVLQVNRQGGRRFESASSSPCCVDRNVRRLSRDLPQKGKDAPVVR